MANRPKVMIDLNVILDVLQERRPFYDASAALLTSAETERIDGYIAAHSVTALFYLIQKRKSSSEARATITNLLQFLKIAPLDQSTIEQSLNLDYKDFEDAVSMMSALQCRADYLITRNIKDFQPALPPVIQPVDFMATL